MKTVYLIVIFLLAGNTLLGQDLDTILLTKYLDKLETENKMMGSVTIAKSGEIIYHKNIGFVDFEKNVKANPNTKYRIASITKTFTAVLVMKAIEENLLSLETHLSNFYPSIKNAEKITIEHLLRHQSGIYNFTEMDDFFQWTEKHHSREEMLTLISSFDSNFEPGQAIDYTNSGYFLLGLILEKLYQKSYDEILQEKITQPLGLHNTYTGSKIKPDANEAFSYKWEKGWKVSYESVIESCLAAGNIISTGPDILKLVDALQTHKILRNNL